MGMPIGRRMPTSDKANHAVTSDGHLQETEMGVPIDAPAELSAVVDELLDALTAKFSSVSSELFSKMDEMSRRIDSLEANIQASNASPGK